MVEGLAKFADSLLVGRPLQIPTDFLTARKVNKGHGRIEVRTITTSEMLNTYAAWAGLAQVYRLERCFQ